MIMEMKLQFWNKTKGVNMKLNELVNYLAVGKKWKEIGCNHVVTITEISSEFADSTMVAFESDCCLSSSPLEMFLKDFTPCN